METRFWVSLLMGMLLVGSSVAAMFSSKLIHRFSDDAKALRVSRNGGLSGSWPERGRLAYYQLLVSSDLQRQKMKLGAQRQLLFPSEGSKTMSFGNDFGWLHYTWIDIGTPNISFLVALDAGSDLLWIPCNCIQCAPLSASYYSSLDKDLNEYSPSGSRTSKHVSCSHQLCDLGQNCKSLKQPCPYVVNYYSENTSSSGFLVEDTLHLASEDNHASKSLVQARVIVGCGRIQSGGYLDGAAPDGLMGLGFADISVPSLLAKAGLVRNSFSLCFNEDLSGRIFFGDQGRAVQQSTQFVPSDGKYFTYMVGVEACCIESTCLKQTGFQAQVDSGTSFTFLPDEVYRKVVVEFDRRVNATRFSNKGYPWEYCYESSSQEMLKIPSLTLMFSLNNSFVVYDPAFRIYGDQGVTGFCLAVQPTDVDFGTIGQNFMTGYRMVFDRENLKLGWSRSNCQDLGDGESPPHGRPPNTLPSNEQQSTPNGNAVAPAIAGRAPSKPSSASSLFLSSQFCLVRLPQLLLLHLCLLLISTI